MRRQDQRHADEAVAHQAHARVDRPTVPFAAENRACSAASDRRRSPRPPPSDRTARRTSRPGPPPCGWWRSWSRSAPAARAAHDRGRAPACIPRRCSGPFSSMIARRSASGSWQKPTSAWRQATCCETPARFSAVGSGGCRNVSGRLAANSVTSQPSAASNSRPGCSPQPALLSSKTRNRLRRMASASTVASTSRRCSDVVSASGSTRPTCSCTTQAGLRSAIGLEHGLAQPQRAARVLRR